MIVWAKKNCSRPWNSADLSSSINLAFIFLPSGLFVRELIHNQFPFWFSSALGSDKALRIDAERPVNQRKNATPISSKPGESVGRVKNITAADSDLCRKRQRPKGARLMQPRFCLPPFMRAVYFRFVYFCSAKQHGDHFFHFPLFQAPRVRNKFHGLASAERNVSTKIPPLFNIFFFEL